MSREKRSPADESVPSMTAGKLARTGDAESQSAASSRVEVKWLPSQTADLKISSDHLQISTSRGQSKSVNRRSAVGATSLENGFWEFLLGKNPHGNNVIGVCTSQLCAQPASDVPETYCMAYNMGNVTAADGRVFLRDRPKPGSSFLKTGDVLRVALLFSAEEASVRMVLTGYHMKLKKRSQVTVEVPAAGKELFAYVSMCGGPSDVSVLTAAAAAAGVGGVGEAERESWPLQYEKVCTAADFQKLE